MATSASGLQVSSALEAFAAGYTNGAMIADKICPIIMHEGINGTYHYRSRTETGTIYEDLTGDDSEPNEITVGDSTATFTALARSLSGLVPYAKIDNADDPLRPKEQTLALVLNDLLIAEERRVSVALHNTANYLAANTAAAGNLWSSVANGTPVSDIQQMIRTVAPGMDGNSKLVMQIGIEAAQALSRHPEMLGLRAGGGTKSGVVTMDEIVTAFDKLDEIWVTDSEYVTTMRGQTPTYAKIWDKAKVVLARVPKTEPRGVEGQSLLCARFRWTSPSQAPMSVYEFDEPNRGAGKGSVRVKASHWTSVPTIIQNDQGYLLTTVV